MEQQNKHPNENKSNHLGRVIFFGAAMGLILGLLLLNNSTLGMGAGAAIGWIVGIVMDTPPRKSG